MKKIILSAIVIASFTILTNSTFAQYGIPAYDVLVVADPTTFEETSAATSFYSSPFSRANLSTPTSASDGEKKMIIEAKDMEISTTAWATVEIYSLDGNITYGPYTIYEGTPFSQYLSDEREWGVLTLAASTECELDVYFE